MTFRCTAADSKFWHVASFGLETKYRKAKIKDRCGCLAAYETCMVSLGVPNNGSAYPKTEICCPLVRIPIQTNSSDTLFYVYDFTSAKIY